MYKAYRVKNSPPAIVCIRSFNGIALKFPPEEPCQPEFDIANFKVDTIFISLTIIIFFSPSIFMMLHHSITAAATLLLCSIHKSSAQLGFDIYGDASRFDPSHSISVVNNNTNEDDSLCDEYTAEIHFNAPKANLPFPPTMPGPNGPGSCNLDDSLCEGQSCLYEVRNVYRLSKSFREKTGFDHVGFDWSPCGHPPLVNFGRPHLNMHIFCITPEERESLLCDMLNPFICKFPPADTQSTVTGRNYFVVGKDAESGQLANAPDTHTYDLDSAVPGEGLHAWNHTGAASVGDWFNPLLVTGLYGGGVQFWEPMFPYEFSSGDTANFYDEAPTYVSQTIVSLPSYWSLGYDPDSEVTTLTIKGKAENCGKKETKAGKKAKKHKKSVL